MTTYLIIDAGIAINAILDLLREGKITQQEIDLRYQEALVLEAVLK